MLPRRCCCQLPTYIDQQTQRQSADLASPDNDKYEKNKRKRTRQNRDRVILGHRKNKIKAFAIVIFISYFKGLQVTDSLTLQGNYH